LKLPRFLPYVLGLILLAFALGSLTRGTPGGSLLFRAYWLLYLVYLGPVVILVVMVAFTVFLALNYRDIAAAIGFKMAQKRGMQKRPSRYTIVIKIFFWALAFGVLIETKGSIFNPTQASNSTLLTNIIGDKATSSNPFKTSVLVPALSELVHSTWFGLAFLGLILVGGVLVVQSVRVSLRETRDATIMELQGKQEQGLQAIHEAIRLVEHLGSDPRSRIIACYQYLTSTVSRLGASVSPNMTARELDRTVRFTFSLKGPATSALTQLFEEARYSLHEITDKDAAKAHELLESVAEELQIQLESAP
jgi:uncharacterized protein DUF4129